MRRLSPEGDSYVHPFSRTAEYAAKYHQQSQSQPDIPELPGSELDPGFSIPATGRGNSDDGANWVNPSPSQLFRALQRANKDPEAEQMAWVSFVHSKVVDTTWVRSNSFH